MWKESPGVNWSTKCVGLGRCQGWPTVCACEAGEGFTEDIALRAELGQGGTCGRGGSYLFHSMTLHIRALWWPQWYLYLPYNWGAPAGSLTVFGQQGQVSLWVRCSVCCASFPGRGLLAGMFEGVSLHSFCWNPDLDSYLGVRRAPVRTCFPDGREAGK